MRIDVDAGLLEESVFEEVRALEAAGERRLARRYFREREKLYEKPPGDAREALAKALHGEWFARLGLDAILSSAAVEIGPALGRADRIVVHSVRSSREEGAELFGRPGDEKGEIFTVVVRLRPSRFGRREELKRFLRHELRLVADLLDPGFGAPREGARARGDARENLVRDRYRLLWEISADGRLARAGIEGLRMREEWESKFREVFGFLPERVRGETFERLYGGPRPRHVELRAIAADPRALDAPRGISPGSPCALCRFPTYDWEPDPAALPLAAAQRIRAAFPDWIPERGLCRECADRYRLAALAPPSPVFAST
jgi:hypothetical protein